VSGSRNRYLIILAFVTGFVVLVDQITKQLALSDLTPGESVSVIGDFLRFTLVYNVGGAFSTRLGPSIFYTVVSLIVAAVVAGFLYRHAGRNRILDFSLAVVVGGALGNLIDRFRFGSVVDWVDFDFFNIHIPPGHILFIEHGGYELSRWPVFNIADAAVTLGVIVILLHILFHRTREDNANLESQG
jgi:signal peptidase II